MPYFMGLDISTTSAKALIIDEQGTVIATAGKDQSISQPFPLWSEQNPEDWWDGIIGAVKGALQEAKLNGDQIQAIGLTGQMHGLVMLDEKGQVLRPAILWNDQRTQAQCEQIEETIGLERFIELTGNRALTGFTAPKILWVEQNEPEVYGKCEHILLPKDYIRYKLTNEYATDLAGAAGTVLLDVANREWSKEVIDKLHIPLSWLPKVHEGTQITGVISSKAADLTGLKQGTPVVGGGGDQAAGAVGMGVVTSNRIGVTVGTSGVVFAPLDKYAYEPEGRLHAFCHAVPDMWHFMGVMLSAAGSLQWYRDTIAPNIDFSQLLQETVEIPAGSEGLFFLPYLTGERTPHPDPVARGVFFGLTSRHTRAHMTRSVLEGVAFGLKDAFTLIDNVGLPEKLEVIISGGGAKSPIWQQIIADVLNAPLSNVNTTETGAFGAAILACVGAGEYGDVKSACDSMIQLTPGPNPGINVDDYTKRYETFQKLYPAVKDIYPEL